MTVTHLNQGIFYIYYHSTYKSRKELQFIPTNLHESTYDVYTSIESNIKTTDWPFVYSRSEQIFTTLGTPAAHYLKFEEGGLHQLVDDIKKREKKIVV